MFSSLIHSIDKISKSFSLYSEISPTYFNLVRVKQWTSFWWSLRDFSVLSTLLVWPVDFECTMCSYNYIFREFTVSMYCFLACIYLWLDILIYGYLNNASECKIVKFLLWSNQTWHSAEKKISFLLRDTEQFLKNLQKICKLKLHNAFMGLLHQRIIESLRLEKTVKIESNHNLTILP